MSNLTIVEAENNEQINAIADCAHEIWNEHFVPIIGQAQVDYMLDKFQSYSAIKEQITKEEYEYYELLFDDDLAGYTGVHQENENTLFLSKLYVKKSFRGNHIATSAFEFLKNLCNERGIKRIWLTCNRYNENTLAIYDHFGFKIFDEKDNAIGNGFQMNDYYMEYFI